ncbi:MAG: hypothetical protein GY715_11755 [Planctomycetes bacterium]|nr:hypothetical protein [Planctomycetota bacterium]
MGFRKRVITELAERVRAIECGGWERERTHDHVETGWPEASLARGVLHEWFGADPPLHLLTHLARRSLREDHPAVVIWIGRRVWSFPTPGPLLERSLFVDPPDDASRLWAIDLTLRNEAVGTVIADGCRLEMSQTRRLQLAAESDASLFVLARPLAELEQLSAAATRWRVTPSPSPNARPRWQLERLRAKGLKNQARTRWTLEWDHHAQGAVALSSDVVDRPRAAAHAPAAPDTRKSA